MWMTFILISAVVLSFYDISKKESVNANAVVPVLCISTFAGLAAFTLALLAQGRLAEACGPTARQYGLVWIKSCLVGVSWVCEYYAMRALPFSIASPIRGSAPFWTIIGAFLLFHEVPTALQAAGMACVLVGYWAFSVVGRTEHISFLKHPGVLLAFAGTMLGAASALFDKYLLQTCRLPRPMLQFWFELDLLVFFGATYLIQHLAGLNRTPFIWRWSIPLVGVLLVTADWFYFAALGEPGVAISILALIRRSNVVLSFLLGILFFHEQHYRKKAIALASIVAGVVLLLLG